MRDTDMLKQPKSTPMVVAEVVAELRAELGELNRSIQKLLWGMTAAGFLAVAYVFLWFH